MLKNFLLENRVMLAMQQLQTHKHCGLQLVQQFDNRFLCVRVAA